MYIILQSYRQSCKKNYLYTSLYYQFIYAIVLKRLKFDFDAHQLDHHLE